MEKALWYFDVVSPFAYIHFHGMQRLRERLDIQAVPVLFAGLLKHWGGKGPAEIAPKRLHTYRYCVWVASQHGLRFWMPKRHPFNPLAAQRLLVALGATDAAVGTAFDFVYGTGHDPEEEFTLLAETLGAVDASPLVASSDVKQGLIANTQRAIDAGVFGVPTLVIRNQLFWGGDTTEWALRYLDDPVLFERPEYRAAAATEFGVARR